MAVRTLVLLGTKKGAFIAESDAERGAWRLRGPFCETWPMNHVIADPATGAILGTGGNEWFGPAVWRSDDLGESWHHAPPCPVIGLNEAAAVVLSDGSVLINSRAYSNEQPAGRRALTRARPASR